MKDKLLIVERPVCLNSQTACAELILRLLGVGEGDEVITTAYTYTASASILSMLGGKVPVVIVSTDTAHSFGATYGKKKTGQLADFSSFSFHAVKNLTTAEGGALTWREIQGIADEDIYKQFQLLSLHGQSKDALAKNQLGAWEYDIVGPWFKCNMTDIMVAICLAQLKRYPSMLNRRKEIIEKYDETFKKLGLNVLNHYTEKYESSGHHLYMLRVPGISEEERNQVIIEMAKKGVACNVHYKPLPMHTAYKNLGYKIENFPNAYNLYKNEITLPLHTNLLDEEIDYVTQTFIEIIKNILSITLIAY